MHVEEVETSGRGLAYSHRNLYYNLSSAPRQTSNHHWYSLTNMRPIQIQHGLLWPAVEPGFYFLTPYLMI